MVAEFGFTISGTERVAFRIEGIAAKALDATAAFELIREDFERSEARLFQSEGGVFGVGKWAPLQQDYARWKEANYPGQPILQLEGDLMESMTDSSSTYAVREITAHAATFGTSVDYATYHQDGIPGRMPARPPLLQTEEIRAMWTLILLRHVMSGARAVAAGLLNDLKGA